MMQIFVDEAGRGPLGGPLFVGLIVKKEEIDWGQYPLFQDSKKLTLIKREKAYSQIQDLIVDERIIGITAQIGAEVIDRYGLTRALHLAVIKGVYQIFCSFFQKKIETMLSYSQVSRFLREYRRQFELVIDGKHDFGLHKEVGLLTRTIIDGDAKVIEIAMASILAKVERDRHMQALDFMYPGYGFGLHKGYGTKLHYEAIDRLGLCVEHRKLFLKKMIPERRIIPFDQDFQLF